jgi:hypothetical protein
MFNLFKKIHINGAIFNGHYIDAKSFYVFKFNEIPCVTFIGDLDVTRAFGFIKETYKAEVTATYQHSYFNHADKKVYFNNMIVVLTYNRMIEIADNFCQVLHAANQYTWARQLITDLAQFRIEGNVAPAFRHTHVVGFAKDAEMN